MNYDEFKTLHPEAKQQSVSLDIIRPTICHAAVSSRSDDQVQIAFFEGIDPDTGTDAWTHVAFLDRTQAVKLRDTLTTALEALSR